MSALEWFLSSVQSHVNLEITFLNGRLGAVWALEELHLPAKEVPLLEVALQSLVTRVAGAASRLQADEFPLLSLEAPWEFT